MKFNYIFFGILFLTQAVFSQKPAYAHLLIDESLKENANAVVRLDETIISITAQNAMTIQSKVVTTVLNDFGLRTLNLSEYFDKNRKISKIDVTVYDGLGKEIKSFKKKDFRDISVADGFSVFNDNRALILNYTPISYPFTIVFETLVETSNTAFIPSWNPVGNFYVSTELSKLKIKHSSDLKLNFKELNFSSDYRIEKTNSTNEIQYTATNIKAKKGEQMSPSYLKIFPIVIFGLDKFNLEGIAGTANSWEEMGKWFYDEILEGTTELPQETILKVKKLVENETDDIKKAELIYKYVQEKTRYVSIQEGIGGWKPMNAKDVDKLGYGDCKALSNYTRALLGEVGVKSYYARLYGQSSIRDIYTDIVSFQSNHVILAIPKGDDYIWLECTSQIQPFGFQGDFTDDRNAFVIKPEGSVVVLTKIFTEKDNFKKLNGFYSISEDGKISAKVKMVSYGIQYDDNFKKERFSKEDQIKAYKEEFDHINNLKINKINFQNDKNKIEFTEELEFDAENYAQNTGGKLMFALNAFNQSSEIPKKHRNREFPFEIQRGYTDVDEITIEIPAGFQVEAMPNDVELTTEYGSYKIEFKASDNQKIVCKRKLIIHKGFYESSKFEEYRKFRETIGRSDNSKVIIFKS